MLKQKPLLILFLLCAMPAQAADRVHLDMEIAATDDNNISRAENSRDIKRDSILSMAVNLSETLKLSEKSGVILRAGLKHNEFAHFEQMSNLVMSLEGIYRIQPIPAYSAPVFDMSLGLDRLQFRASGIRDGYQAHAGLGASSRLTDRIKVKLTGEYERRWADETSVFEWEHQSLIASTEYRLAKGNLYLDYAFTRGDQVFTATPSVSIRQLAQAFADDDVFGGRRAYRLDAVARQLNLGYQLPLNSTSSLDVGMKLIDISAEGSSEYQDKQLRISWLYRFF
jgi:hypothetical protein